MSCLWNFCWKRSKPSKPIVLADTKTQNPLYVSEIPNSEEDLQFWEAALRENIGNLHYKIEETKKRIGYEIRNGRTNSVRNLIAKNNFMLERKLFFETRLEKVQKKLTSLR